MGSQVSGLIRRRVKQRVLDQISVPQCLNQPYSVAKLVEGIEARGYPSTCPNFKGQPLTLFRGLLGAMNVGNSVPRGY